MLRQYSPQRFRYEEINRSGIAYPVGTIPIGSIFYLAAGHDGSCRRKCMVRAWRTRRTAHRRLDGMWEDVFLLRFGHLAQVEDLATGRLFDLAGHHILRALEGDE